MARRSFLKIHEIHVREWQLLLLLSDIEGPHNFEDVLSYEDLIHLAVMIYPNTLKCVSFHSKPR